MINIFDCIYIIMWMLFDMYIYMYHGYAYTILFTLLGMYIVSEEIMINSRF
jgi:hypothetical protein